MTLEMRMWTMSDFYHSRDCRSSPLFPHCDCGAQKARERLDELEQLEQERSDCEYSPMWVVLFCDHKFVSLHGSEFAARETAVELNKAAFIGEYYVKEVCVESV